GAGGAAGALAAAGPARRRDGGTGRCRRHPVARQRPRGVGPARRPPLIARAAALAMAPRRAGNFTCVVARPRARAARLVRHRRVWPEPALTRRNPRGIRRAAEYRGPRRPDRDRLAALRAGPPV